VIVVIKFILNFVRIFLHMHFEMGSFSNVSLLPMRLCVFFSGVNDSKMMDVQ